MDEGGDDTYRGLQGAVQSAAWDLGIAVLWDRKGNDRYDAGALFFSQAAASHNGFSWFIDEDGIDTYITAGEGLSAAPSNTYHGGSSLSIFLDAGGHGDHYGPGSTNNHLRHKGRHAIFADLDVSLTSLDRTSLDFLKAKAPAPDP